MSDRPLMTPFMTASRGEPAGAGTWTFPTGQQPPRLHSIWPALIQYWRRSRSRAALARLDAHMLKDIGLSYAEAENEANKPFWRS